jgi:hypothetical protein
MVIGEDNERQTVATVMTLNPVQITISKMLWYHIALMTADANSERWARDEQHKKEN